MIRAEHIIKSFEGRTVLKDISATFETGKTNLIIGQSGSGKTVLLKSLVGLHTIDSGKIFYDDVCYTTLSFKERKAIRQQIGMIFQDPMTSLNPLYTVGNQLEETLKLHMGLEGAALKKRAIELLEMADITNRSRQIAQQINAYGTKRNDQSCGGILTVQQCTHDNDNDNQLDQGFRRNFHLSKVFRHISGMAEYFSTNARYLIANTVADCTIKKRWEQSYNKNLFFRFVTLHFGI